nr:hypothetical protein [Streptomyces blattellae]
MDAVTLAPAVLALPGSVVSHRREPSGAMAAMVATFAIREKQRAPAGSHG